MADTVMHIRILRGRPCSPGQLAGDRDGWAAFGVVAVMGFLALLLAVMGQALGTQSIRTGKTIALYKQKTRLLERALQVQGELETLFSMEGGLSCSRWKSFGDEWMTRGVELEELSSRFNPNWVRSAILEKPEALPCWKDGAVPELIAQDREDHGFSLDIATRYGSFFESSFMNRFMSPWPDFNLNVACEFSLRQAYRLLTGDSASAEVFWHRLKDARANRVVLDEEKAGALLAPFGAETSRLLTCRPPLNLNLVQPEVLDMLVHAPALGLANPDFVYDRLISRRDTGYVPRSGLKLASLVKNRSSAIDAGRALQNWLGDQSSHVSARIREGEGQLNVVFRLEYPAGSSVCRCVVADLVWSSPGTVTSGESGSRVADHGK